MVGEQSFRFLFCVTIQITAEVLNMLYCVLCFYINAKYFLNVARIERILTAQFEESRERGDK